ncbi:MAG: T9SS type A sorting domain-containing protein [Ignavibacteria bacterium]|nr:T9SS type A sorting domain-containing protein [Ignavibacteria bacterium]
MKKINLNTMNVTAKTFAMIIVILSTLLITNIKAEVMSSENLYFTYIDTGRYLYATGAEQSNSNRNFRSVTDTPDLKPINLKTDFYKNLINAKSSQANAARNIEYPKLELVNTFKTASYSFQSIPDRLHISSIDEKDSFENDILNMENLTINSPLEFYLSQNYPNPFNPDTKITFNILKSAFVKLTVYDNLGKEVKTLVNENLQAGLNTISFNGSSLSSGIYYYKLEVDGLNEVKRMMLIK